MVAAAIIIILAAAALCLFYLYGTRSRARDLDATRDDASSASTIDRLAASRLLARKNKALLRGAFVYDVDLVEMSPTKVSLRDGDMAKKLMAHVQAGLVDTLVFPPVVVASTTSKTVTATGAIRHPSNGDEIVVYLDPHAQPSEPFLPPALAGGGHSVGLKTILGFSSG